MSTVNTGPDIACYVIIAMACEQAISPGSWHREWQGGMRGQWARPEANGLFCAEEETWMPLCNACLAWYSVFLFVCDDLARPGLE